MRYTELQTTTNFSFLRGGSHPEELVAEAADYGYAAIAITDRNSFAGIVRAHTQAKKKGIRLIPACRLDLQDGPPLLAYPTNQHAYTQLSALLTLGNLRVEKGDCQLYKADVYAHAKGMKFIMLSPATLNSGLNLEPAFLEALQEYRQALGADLYLSACRTYGGNDGKLLHRLSQISSQAGVPLVATNDVYYHNPARRQLQDILTCIREKCTIHNAGFRLHQNAERHLKQSAEMMRLFRQYPDAIHRTQEISEACQFSLDSLKYVYPEEITREGRTPQQELVFLAWKGAAERYNHIIPEKISAGIRHELRFIEEMKYAAYFLTVYDIVRFARQQGILCQGRGSAANSTVCYCLGITSVDPSKFDLLFERFISSARNEPPDIDVDFEHERREEVIQYIYRKYGRHRAAIVATVTQERQKGAIRDVGKAMGLSVDTINQISGATWEFTEEWFAGNQLAGSGMNPADKHLRKTLELTEQLIGFPRQLGQHTGGFVITQGNLSDVCPVMNARMENRTCIEWNKDDIDALGFLKIDVLALGMLTCIRKAFDLCKKHYSLDLTLANIPTDDPVVYNMISHAETIGVFQIESRAQQSMLPRLKPTCFYDLVIEVAIVRPGPIQGDMVHPYLRRRNKLEEVEYPSKELEEILKKTLGIPLFQEQAMKIAIVAAGFTPAEADELRRSMATFKAKGMVKNLEEKLTSGMVKNGYTPEYAQCVFKQLEGFGSYGFPESHAASFAQLVYVSSWLKCYYPDVFATALLNSMPMGFYQPAQIIIDAKKNGVVFRPVDVNESCWDNTLEEKTGKYHALRLGFRQVKGLREADINTLLSGRQEPYTSINALKKAGLSPAALEKLGDADAFGSIDLNRREALWEITAPNDQPIALFVGQESLHPADDQPDLPAMTAAEQVVQDYAATSFSLKAHPVSFVREKLELLHIIPASALQTANNGDCVKIAGLVLVRQRPGTAKGVCFITIEDETGFANLVVFQTLFNTYRKPILQSRLLMVEGILQREEGVIHVIVKHCADLSKFLRHLTTSDKEDRSLITLSRSDETSIPAHAQSQKKPGAKESTEKEIFFGGRNFK
ncbi:MAG: error-prone DNA polymerase [Bacteroidota bacterium]